MTMTPEERKVLEENIFFASWRQILERYYRVKQMLHSEDALKWLEDANDDAEKQQQYYYQFEECDLL